MKITFEDLRGMNVPAYCRKIMKKDYPKTLEIYRGEMLCLTVDVEKAAKLKLVENNTRGPVYEKYTDSGFLNSEAETHVPPKETFK